MTGGAAAVMPTQNFGYRRLYIDGQLVDAASGKRMSVICPATGEAIAEVAEAGVADVERALEAAKKGQKAWGALPLKDRAAWMAKLRTAVLAREAELRAAIVHEMGKTWAGSYEDVEAVANALEWYPAFMRNLRDEQIPDDAGTHTHKMLLQPAGVAVAYLAWNFPLLNVGFKLGPALAAGCSIIIKPSEMSPLSTYLIGEILHSIDFPAGVVNILCGQPDEVATPMSRSRIPAVLTMIGSSATGRRVIADSATSIKKLALELGGNAPFIVFSDADIETALGVGIGVKYGNSGQICVAPNRFLVHEKIYDQFLEAYITKARNLKLGFGVEKEVDMGSMINAAACDRMLALLEDAKAKGGKIECGGRIPAGFQKGFWMEPTVVSGMTTEMDLFRKETFGPIAPFMKFSSDDEALELANDTEYGLASYIFTNNHARIQRFSQELEFGEVQVNGIKYHISLPHGGIKNSGLGHDCSHLALDDYLVKKRVTEALP